MSENTPAQQTSLFWVIFLYGAVQTAFALEINFSRNTDLFVALPAISILFGVFTLRAVTARFHEYGISLPLRILTWCGVIAFYVLATGFFAITAIFIGGLPG